MKKLSLLLILFLLLILVVLGLEENIGQTNIYKELFSQSKINKDEIWVGSHKIMVEVVDTPVKRAKGLSGRDLLGQGEGMLFVFEQLDFYRFWMKDMKIPLDFIWIQGDQIVDITENVPSPKNVSDYLLVYQPKEAVDKVLEVNAGWVKGHNVKIGDKIQIKN